MILKTKGKAHNIEGFIVGRVTFDPQNKNCEILVREKWTGEDEPVHKAWISVSKDIEYGIMPCIEGISTSQHLEEGDIVVLHSDGVINTVYRVNSQHNFLLFTEQCNSNCLMCA